jgi:hypothetical protein
LSRSQEETYDLYANAFGTIRSNLNAALEATNVTSASGNVLNRDAKRNALSRFESVKLRFFNQLLLSLKAPAVIASIETDIAKGCAVVVQLTSTAESVLERRLADLPSSEWNDLTVDLSPRDAIMEYVSNAFPTALFESKDSGV